MCMGIYTSPRLTGTYCICGCGLPAVSKNATEVLSCKDYSTARTIRHQQLLDPCRRHLTQGFPKADTDDHELKIILRTLYVNANTIILRFVCNDSAPVYAYSRHQTVRTIPVVVGEDKRSKARSALYNGPRHACNVTCPAHMSPEINRSPANYDVKVCTERRRMSAFR